jgi:carboxymethylenebutenolidase
MDQRLIDLHHDYVHHHFDRRPFLEEAATLVGGITAAAALLPLLDSDYARAETIKESDPRIVTERITFTGATGAVKGYLAKPKGDGRHPGVVVIHEIGGVNPHIEDIARRLGTEGYVALAVDFLSPLGGTPIDGKGAAQIAMKLNPAQTAANGVAAVKYLRSRPDVNGKVGEVGFCWGGRVAQAVAVEDPTLDAAVVFYGEPPNPSEAPKLRAPLLMNFADPKLDVRNGEEVLVYENALKAAGKDYELHFYPGAQHGFNNDTNAPRYNEAAAKEAWGRTLDWFRKYLG